MSEEKNLTKKYTKRDRVSLFGLNADGKIETHDEDYIEVVISGELSSVDSIEIDEDNPKKLVIAQAEKQTVGISLKGVVILGDLNIANISVNGKPEKHKKVLLLIKVPVGTEIRMTDISGNIVSSV